MGKKRLIKEEKPAHLKEEKSIDALVEKDLRTKKVKKIEEANIYIFATYNNTILNLTDLSGNTIFQSSAGKVGFEGTKKGTHYAGSRVAEVVAQAVKLLQISKVNVFVKGVGPGRDAALRTLASKDVNIVSIADITPIPHNGCRPKKVRKV
ncbi:MAG: 30S ribosomal protein S11 [Minisyncoccales bacterium]